VQEKLCFSLHGISNALPSSAAFRRQFSMHLQIKVFGNNQNKQAEVAKPGQALFPIRHLKMPLGSQRALLFADLARKKRLRKQRTSALYYEKRAPEKGASGILSHDAKMTAILKINSSGSSRMSYLVGTLHAKRALRH